MENIDEDFKESPPPIMGTWKRLYWFVLILHAVMITLFYFFMKAYS